MGGYASLALSGEVKTLALCGDRKPLKPQHRFEGTISRRYVKAVPITLQLEDGFWAKPHHEPYQIKDVKLNKVLFKVPVQSSSDEIDSSNTSPQRRLLLDAYGVPIVGLEAHQQLPATANCTEFAVIPGSRTATNELFRFVTRFNLFEWPLSLYFNEKSTADVVRIFVTHSWLAQKFLICIQRGRDGPIFMIGRVYVVGDFSEGKYRIDVAPGVDLSLVVLFADAMDEQSTKYVTPKDRAVRKTAIKEAKRQQKATAMQG